MQGDAQIKVTGRLTDNPALDVTRSGQSWCRFSIATNPRHFNKDTNAWEAGEASFWRVVVWGDMAEHVCESLGKGDQVVVDGTVTIGKWERENKSGLDVEIRAEEVAVSLRWKNVKVVRTERASAGQVLDKEDDPWATARN